MNERARDDQLLPHSVAVALDELVGPILEIEQRHQLASAVLDLVSVLSVQSGDETKEFRAGELVVDEGSVGNEAELRFRGQGILCEADSRGWSVPTRRLANPGDHAQRGRLSSAVGPEKSEQLAVGNAQINGIN